MSLQLFGRIGQEPHHFFHERLYPILTISWLLQRIPLSQSTTNKFPFHELYLFIFRYIQVLETIIDTRYPIRKPFEWKLTITKTNIKNVLRVYQPWATSTVLTTSFIRFLCHLVRPNKVGFNCQNSSLSVVIDVWRAILLFPRSNTNWLSCVVRKKLWIWQGASLYPQRDINLESSRVSLNSQVSDKSSAK